VPPQQALGDPEQFKVPGMTPPDLEDDPVPGLSTPFKNSAHLPESDEQLDPVPSQEASFIIDFHNDGSKSGTFKFVDPEGELSFEAKASSGLQTAANNPYTQSFKDQGLIPSGTWKIELITEPKTPKERELNKYPPIFRLTPGKDVELSGLNTNKYRDGFLIHSGKDPLTASQGCIILDNVSRQKLKEATLKYGSIELKVGNKVY
jgi:hypothetical protein